MPTTAKHILDKIQRLLALATSSNEHEAASAAAQAARLMDEHRISTADLNTDTSDDPMGSIFLDGLPGVHNRCTWKEQLASKIADANGCFIHLHDKAVVITGKFSDVQVVRYLYEYLTREINTITTKRCAGMGKRYANSFRLGCVTTVADKLKRDDSAEGQYALVLVNNRVDSAREFVESFAKLKSGQGPKVTMDHHAYLNGKRAGEKIQVHRGLDKGSESNALLLGSGT